MADRRLLALLERGDVLSKNATEQVLGKIRKDGTTAPEALHVSTLLEHSELPPRAGWPA